MSDGFKVRGFEGNAAGKVMALAAHADARGIPYMFLSIDLDDLQAGLASYEAAVHAAANLASAKYGCHGKHALVDALRRAANEIELVPC